MPNWKDPDWLLGRRFVCDFTVLSIKGNADELNQTVRLQLNGEPHEIGLGELHTIIERGLVVESTAGRSH